MACFDITAGPLEYFEALTPAKETMTPIPLDESGRTLGRRAAVVVAHPDDETLWCGGYILTHPEFLWRIVTLCRAVGSGPRAKVSPGFAAIGGGG